MDRNFPKATEMVHQVIADLQPFTEILPPQDRLIFSRFADYALSNRPALEDTANGLPLEATMLVLVLQEHRLTQRLHAELYAQIERLKEVTWRLEGILQAEEGNP